MVCVGRITAAAVCSKSEGELSRLHGRCQLRHIHVSPAVAVLLD